MPKQFARAPVEAIRMLEAGVATAEDIDKAMVLGYRHPVGPLKLTDMVGLDVRMHIGEYLARIFGSFDFEGVELALPTRVFEDELEIAVGDRAVRLFEAGPAHTAGDVLVHSPADRTIFTGDILFIDVTPIMWAGPVRRWIAACERIATLDVDVIVPGHGPVTDKAGVAQVRAYLEYVDAEARRRFDAGLSVEEAAHDIALGDFESWGDSERIVVNVDTLYREYRGDPSPPDVMRLFSLMGALDAARR